jgi:ABC-type multidrug transport system ATPase subunit
MTAWFRVFYAFGDTMLCWWDTETHVYRSVSPEEEYRYSLRKLHEIVTTIHVAAELDFFSSEIAVTRDGKFVAVDYVNEICDMRQQSDHIDGVPDDVVAAIERGCARAVRHSTGSETQKIV